MQVTFSHPWLLLVLVLPAAVLLLRVLWRPQNRPALPLSTFACVPLEAGRRPLAQRVFLLLRFLSLFCLVPPIAGMRTTSVSESAAFQPSALVIVLDASSSMTALDFPPENRIEEAKKQLKELVASCPGLHMGLIRCAATPHLLMPVTTDHRAVMKALDEVRPAGYGEDGTAIGSGIASAVNRLRDGPWMERRILLVTDGVSNRGAVSPTDAALLAEKLGVKVEAIGLGTGTISRFWIPTASGAAAEVEARIEIDDRALEEVGRLTGGAYQRVRDPSELRRALSLVAKRAQPAKAEPDRIWTFLWAKKLALLALLLMSMEFLLSALLIPELPGS